MKIVRETNSIAPGAIHLLDSEGDLLSHFINFNQHRMDNRALYLLRNEIAPHWLFHVLDVSSENPLGFTFLQYDTRCQFASGRNLEGVTIGDAAPSAYSDGAAETYATVRKLGLPRVTREFIFGDTSRSFLRQAIPLIVKGRVEKIVVASRYQDIAGAGDILGKETPGASEKKKDPVSASQRAISTSVSTTTRHLLSVTGLKPVDPKRNTFFDYFRKSIGKDPISSFLQGNRLAIHC
jgi:hypothetical protein